MQLYNLKILDAPLQNFFRTQRYTDRITNKKIIPRKDIKGIILGCFTHSDTYSGSALRMQRCLQHGYHPQGAQDLAGEVLIKQW